MTLRQRKQKKPTPREQRAFETATVIFEASGLRYRSSQIDGLALILMAYHEHETALELKSQYSSGAGLL